MERKYEYNFETAKTYKEIGIEGTTYEAAFNGLIEILKNLDDKVVLDFGSGAGRSAKFLKSLGAKKVIGVDHNESMIEESIAQNIDGAEFYLVNEKIPVSDTSIDIVLSTWVFMEMGDIEDIKKCFVEIARVLKPKGKFLVVVANPEAAFGHDYVNFKYIDKPNELKSGDETKLIIKADKPFTISDHYWTLEDYENSLRIAGFVINNVIYPKPEAGNWLDEVNVPAHMIIESIKK